MIKLIASDIDGTLVKDGESSINPEIFPLILALRKKGIQFAAASGRQWTSIEKLFDPIKEKIFYVSDNGAYIGCHGRSLFVNKIDKDLAAEVIKEIRKRDDLEMIISGPNGAYMETKNEEFLDLIENGYRISAEVVEDLTKVEEDFIKIALYRKESIESETQDIRNKFEGRLKMTIAGDLWLDLMTPGVSKGQAIKLIQDSLDILPEETMVFGDQMNDIEMLNQAYYSFAIGNAREEVKETARFQADTNVNYGVLKILKLLCGDDYKGDL